MFGVLMIQLNFSHKDIMELPFKTFLAYHKLLSKPAQAEDKDIEKWRAESKKWVAKNVNKG